MHAKISDATILTIIICTILLVMLGGIIISFLFAYQKKSHNHEQELLILKEDFNKTLLLSKLEIQEQTLDHIAKELHANISHLVSVININLSAHLQQYGDGPDENIHETKLLVKQLMAEIKGLSVALNTEHIGKAGFQRMLRNELERLTKTGLYEIQFLVLGQEYRLAPEREIILFRLCQEIINNIIRHAMAEKINIELHYEASRLIIKIADNGVGFSKEQAENGAGNNGSTGLSNIHSRCRQINGGVLISSARGSGTSVIVTIPTIPS